VSRVHELWRLQSFFRRVELLADKSRENFCFSFANKFLSVRHIMYSTDISQWSFLRSFQGVISIQSDGHLCNLNSMTREIYDETIFLLLICMMCCRCQSLQIS
jgi:hypothetical protein